MISNILRKELDEHFEQVILHPKWLLKHLQIGLMKLCALSWSLQVFANKIITKSTTTNEIMIHKLEHDFGI